MAVAEVFLVIASSEADAPLVQQHIDRAYWLWRNCRIYTRALPGGRVRVVALVCATDYPLVCELLQCSRQEAALHVRALTERDLREARVLQQQLVKLLVLKRGKVIK